MANLKNTIINDSGFVKLPSGTTSQRPGSPTPGMIRYNTEADLVEAFTDNWRRVGDVPKDGSSVEKAATSPADLDQEGVTASGNYFVSPPGYTGAELVYCTQVNGQMHMNFRLEENELNYIFASKNYGNGSIQSGGSIAGSPDYSLWNQINSSTPVEYTLPTYSSAGEIERFTNLYVNPQNTSQVYPTDFIAAVANVITDSPDRMLSHIDDQDSNKGCTINNEFYITYEGAPDYNTTALGGSKDFRFVEFQLSNGSVTITRQDNQRSPSDPGDSRYFMPTEYETGDYDTSGCSGGSTSWGWGYNNQTLRVRY